MAGVPDGGGGGGDLLSPLLPRGGDDDGDYASFDDPPIPSAGRDDCCDGSRSAVRCVAAGEPSSTCCDDDAASQSRDGAPACSAKDTGCCVLTHVCLAVIRPDDDAVDVFDARGRCKTFRIEKRGRGRTASFRNACFSDHGAGAGAYEAITPCFDGNGEHDEPDEDCPCGVEEPHLHAHVFNAKVCAVADEGCASVNSVAKKKAGDWRFLSQLTLVADDEDEGEDEDEEAAPVTSRVPVSERAPAECNSAVVEAHLAARGMTSSDWRRNQAHDDERCRRPRLYPVRHGDHVDYLVQDEASGDLLLEHPCDACGKADIQGWFKRVHVREWTAADGRSRIRLEFFRAPDEPFRLLDALASLFPLDLESGRVAAVQPAAGRAGPAGGDAAREDAAEDGAPPSSRVGKSEFHVEGICCAAEIPEIDSIVRPMEGVSEVSVIPTTKTVYVDHDVDVASADAIATALNDEGFGASVKKDAAAVMDQTAGIPTDVFVNSTFDLTAAVELAEKSAMADAIRACLDQKFSEGQFKNVAVAAEDKTLAVDHNPHYLTATGIADALAVPFGSVEIVVDGGADGMWALPLMKEEEEDAIELEKSNVRWSVVLSGVFWGVSMLSLVGGNWSYLEYVALLSVACGLPPIAAKAFRTLRRCHFDVNCMMLFAAVGALPLRQFTESAAVTFLFAVSEALETRATARARNALSALAGLRPEIASVVNPVTGDVVVLPAAAVAVGARVSVGPGDRVPCDGVVAEGRSAVDESSLTGESRPVGKSPGMRVSGGTVNAGNTRLMVRTTATSNDSAVSRLIRLVEEAQSNRSDTEKLVDSFAKIYTPIVILTALCMCTIPWAFGTEVGKVWVYNGLITIIIACPCALIISTPVTYVAGLAAAAQKGVIVKGGQHLEGLGRVKSIAFDKTGTLSQGVFEFLHLEVVGRNRSRKEVFEYLALMEAPASHPLSAAIVKGASNEGITIPKLQVQNHTLLPGEGITANVDSKDVHVGNKKLFQRLNLYDALEDSLKVLAEEWAQSGGTIGFISIEGEGILGAYCVSDKIRDEARDAVRALKRMGIEITMLTGDQRPAAIGIGSQIGLEEHDIKSELLPEDKLTEIRDAVKENQENKKCCKGKGAVMMVGDGVNDAPALALADVSVAMGEGAALAMDTADVTLMDSNLNKLLFIVRMGRRVTRTIIENVVFSLIVKAIVMGFTFAGKASLWAAIASDVGAMLIVTLNGMKLLPREGKKKLAQISPAEAPSLV